MSFAAPLPISGTTPSTEKLKVFALAGGLLVGMLGLIAGDSVAALGELVALAAVIGLVARYANPLPPFALAAIGITYILLLIYLFDGLAGAFPGTYPFLLGLRKALPPWIFLAAGYLLPSSTKNLVVRWTTVSVAVAAIASLYLHNFDKSLEGSIQRHAGVYTSLYAGSTRLQGVFAGPFHAAMAGGFLIVVAVTAPGLFRRWVGLVIAVVGLLVVAQANVRSAWVGLALAIAVVALGRPRTAIELLRNRLALVAASLGAVAVIISTGRLFDPIETIDSVFNWQHDARFQSRATTYHDAWQMIVHRPLLGWGSGSAGDTMDRFFPAGHHITAHNLILKYAVETGFIGAAGIAALAASVFILVWRRRTQLSTTTLALFALFLAFGATGSAVDAVPVAWVVLLVVGSGIGDRSLRTQTG